MTGAETTLTSNDTSPTDVPREPSTNANGSTDGSKKIKNKQANMVPPAPTSVASFPHLVFGYGSLICPESRAITAPTTVGRDVLPVQVHNVERTWAKLSKRGMTSMGVRFREGAECVGVLVPVTDKELKQFDKREIGYYRAQLDLDDVLPVPFLDADEFYEDTFLEEAAAAIADEKEERENGDSDSNGSKSDASADQKANDSCASDESDGETSMESGSESDAASKRKEAFKTKIWVYVQKDPTPATEPYPIVQSYLDIILRGCLTISEEFAKEFIETTRGWDPAELIEEEGDDDDEDDDDETKGAEETKDADEPKQDSNNETDKPEVVWVNDRHDPIYIRADTEYSLENAEEIDGLLKEHLPETIKKRRRRRRRNRQRRNSKKAGVLADPTQPKPAVTVSSATP